MPCSSIASCAWSRSLPTSSPGESPGAEAQRPCWRFPPARQAAAGLRSAIAWSPARRLRRRRLREQPFGSELTGSVLEIPEQASNLVELRPQLFDSAQFRCDLSQRTSRIRVQSLQPPLARFQLPAERTLPALGLLLQRAQLGLGRRTAIEHRSEEHTSELQSPYDLV